MNIAEPAVKMQHSASYPNLTGKVGAEFDELACPVSTYALVGGILPAGLDLNTATGHITGRPTVPGRADVKVQSTSVKGSETHDLVIVVK